MAELGGVTPYLTVRGANAAADFYRRAFGAEELFRQPAENGERLLHCHLRINGGDILMSDDFSDAPSTPSCVTIHLQVDDADRWWQRALDAGAEVKMPLEDQFWGDRYGQLRDPFGHSWSIASPAKST